MDDDPKRIRSNKSSRKFRKSSRTSNQISSQLPHRSENVFEQTTNNLDNDFLKIIIDGFTSDIDEIRVSSPSILSTTTTTNYNDRCDLSIRKQTIGEQRRHQLTKQVKTLCQDCFEFTTSDQISNLTDIQKDSDKRKQYYLTLWYELKTFFNGINFLDENEILNEQHFIDRQRKISLDDFYKLFHQSNFEQTYYHNTRIIQRRHICEYHLNHCYSIENYMKNLFLKWDYILSLFPSYSALEQYDKRFNPRTKEGGIFYEKLSIFQAWFNLHSEINRLIHVLGKIMTCTQCHMWPHGINGKFNENISRPTTPSSTSSNEQKDILIDSSPISSNFGIIPEIRRKRQNTLSSISSIDGIYQQYLTSTSSLMEYYYRYIDDQLTHARIELIASIFRSKHGPLLQRLRYTYRKEQRISSSTFDDIFKNSPYFPITSLPNDYLLDAKPDKLIDEFFLLNKQLQKYKNPDLINKKKKTSKDIYSNKVNNILNRFDQNPTLTSSTFPPVPAPTLVLKLLSHDRIILKRQSYFLDYLDPTSYPHLPGSTLFPDPCSFIDNTSFYFSSQITSDENILITKMLNICHRLYDKHVWIDSGRFSDMCDIFHLPSLYPHYVFLVQIPLDLMIAWQKYHQDKKMEQTSSTSALLLLIDECKIFIHSAILIRQYVKLMITDTFEKSELKLIEDDLIQYDRNLIDIFNELLIYIERYIDICLRSNLFDNCILLLKDQWKYLKKYSTIINQEEILGEKFLNMFSNIIQHFSDYIDIFHSITDSIKIEHIKKKIHRKYQKQLTINILREAKIIYDDCTLTINIYLQKPVCKRFLLILKTAGFERIKFASENYDRHSGTNQMNKDGSPLSKCLLFAPAEYFEDNTTKIQLIQTLSSSFRINTNMNTSIESNDDQPPLQQQSPTSTQQPSILISENSPPLVYILCVPISIELESEWHGITHIIPENKNFLSKYPLHTHWKTTTIFLLTQQTNNLEKIENLFKERLSKINIQQNDLYNSEIKSRQILQKYSCFEKIDQAMKNLAHSMLNLTNCITNNVENFEKIIEKNNIRNYVHTEEVAFSFGMDIIRETSFYATQCEYETLKTQSERQLLFANIWLNFVRRKKSITKSRYSITIPMWLLPGIHFLRHICSLQFTSHINNDLFTKFYTNMKQTFYYLNKSNEMYHFNQEYIPLKIFHYSTKMKYNYEKKKKKEFKLNLIEKLDRMDKDIDRRRAKNGLIGKIIKVNKTSTLSRKMEDEIAYLKIRNFHKLNLLSCGQFATTYKCTVNRGDKKEVLCYKQYKIQHNDAQAITKVLEQLMPLMHIDHENLIKYHGIALEHEHILFFMEYCSYGTIAQLLLGTSLSSSSLSSSSHIDARYSSIPLMCSINDIGSIDSGIIQTPMGFVFFQEFLVQRYLRQLLSALSCLHKKEIIHRDIRNVNIFLTDSTKQSIKLGDVNFVYDFKFMKKQSSLYDMDDVVNIRESIVFYAPETITQDETTIKSDIWSLGCTIIHMLTGHIPWSNPTIASNIYYLKILRLVADGGQPPIPTDLSLSKECIDFLEQCFQHDPNRRPSSDILLEHPFVKEQ